MIGDQPVCVPHFVPLKTKQGMHPNELLRRLDGRALVIWGCGHMGRAMVRVLRKFCAPETTLFFCDRRAALIGTRVDGVPVLSVDTAIHDARDRRSMVVVAVGGGLAEIVRQAE